MGNQEENFKDPSSIKHLAMIIIALVAMPLLPMVMGWYTMLK